MEVESMNSAAASKISSADIMAGAASLQQAAEILDEEVARADGDTVTMPVTMLGSIAKMHRDTAGIMVNLLAELEAAGGAE